MPVQLEVGHTFPWNRPGSCPADFQTDNVYLGRSSNDALAEFEVAVCRWVGAGTPGRDALGKLHAARLNKRAVPVLVAVELSDGSVMTYGPNVDVAPVGPLPADLASRMLQAVLDEPDQIKAGARWRSFTVAVDTSSLPGVKNSGLFANHEVRVGVPQREDWSDACRRSAKLLNDRQGELIRALGFTSEQGGAHSLVLSAEGPHPHAVAVLLDESEAFDTASDRFAVSPVAYGLAQADKQGVAWLLLLRGGQVRLYPARSDLGVGRKGLAETFFELDLPQLTQDTAGYLTLVFSAAALAEGGTAFQILDSSAQYAVGLGERLREKVYNEIIPELSLSVALALNEDGLELDADGLDTSYQVTLRIFFRLLFQVYAEDRKLLPFGENPRYDRNALKTVAKDLAENPDQEFDPESTTLWDDLAQVWWVIDRGDKAWGVPPYNGGLFATDELHPLGLKIDSIRISNDVMGPVLKHLMLDDGDDGELAPIDFRALGVREFGTIYEGLLESSLGLAEVDLTLDKDDTWVPAKKGDEVWAEAGDVYFHNTSGQRKGTGSYFTPSFVVEHLLERSLDPALDDHLAKVGELLGSGDQAGAAELFFDFRVADLAMGSGHFLTAAVDHIEKKMAAFLAEDGHQIPGVTAELRELGKAAVAALGADAVTPEPSALLRRQIARRCIYGLDINPIAVELARVSIWIHTFVRGLPMSSLDHNLVCANSLTGIGSVEEALDVLVPGRKGALTLFDGPITDALESARETLLDVANSLEADRTQTQAAAKAVAKARKEAETAKLLFDAAVLTRIGRDDLLGGADPGPLAKRASRPEAQEVLSPLMPAHMPVLFPEVFLRGSGGFDVLVGNPPWDKVEADKQIFITRHFPGFRTSGSQAEKDRQAKALLEARPDLLADFEKETAERDLQRATLCAGPFPGMGVDHPDLAKAFAWRNVQLLSAQGRMAVVLPRTVLSGRAMQEWRAVLLSSEMDTELSLLANAGGYVFPEVHAQKEFVLAVSGRSRGLVAGGRFAGPLSSREQFEEDGRNFIEIETKFLGDSLEIPSVPSAKAFEVLAQAFESSQFASSPLFMQSVYETDAAKNKPDFVMDFNEQAEGLIPVYKGESFNLWSSETGSLYARADESHIRSVLTSKISKSSNKRNSAFFGFDVNDANLPLYRARIAYRWTTNSTNRRTLICALIPPKTVLTNGTPYLFNRGGRERDEAYLLGVFSSIPFDWMVRRYVEGTMRQGILNSLPIPDLSERAELRSEIESVVVANIGDDQRFATWASSVSQGSTGTHGRSGSPDSLELLDALVATAYGFTREHVQLIFTTFHRGWDYQSRLDAVLAHFDRIEG